MTAGVALAAALSTAAVGIGARNYIAPAVEQAMDCAAVVLQGGGATCDPAADEAVAENSLSQDFVDSMAQFFADMQNGDIGWVL
jgi:hypothetical protein